MREVMSIHVGQAGLQMGSSIWELYCLEHGVQPDGRLLSNGLEEPQYEGFKSFFTETSCRQYKPISVLIDLEPTVADQIRRGPYKDLFSSNQLLSGKEDAANNYARGYYSSGKKLLTDSLEEINKAIGDLDSFQGFLIFHSIGGGTGSGFAALLMEHLSDYYGKKNKLQLAIYPAPQISTAVVEPYNVVLNTNATLEHTDCSFIADNEAMYEICQEGLGIDRPNYLNLNRVLSQAYSSMTASIRFDGPLNVDLNEFQTNLVPYPRIHFPHLAYAPIVSSKDLKFNQTTASDITSSCFKAANQMVKFDVKNCRYVACCLLYRGDIRPQDINTAIVSLKHKKTVKFVSWSPTGFKVGINSRPPTIVEGSELAEMSRSVCMLSNTSGIAEAWQRLNSKFDKMYNKNAFIHWYTMEGLEQEEFREARITLGQLESDYQEIANDDMCI